MRARHIHHLFFPSGSKIYTRGIIRWGATEITIYRRRGTPPIVPEGIESHLSVHQIELEPQIIQATEKLNEDFEELVKEEMLLCINLDECVPLVSQAALLQLYQRLEIFHHGTRPTLGSFCTIMYYQTVEGTLWGLPLIPKQPELCSIIYRILAKDGMPFDKERIRERLHDIDDSITKDKVDSALIALENWLRYYPGFTATQEGQRKKKYQIEDLSKFD